MNCRDIESLILSERDGVLTLDQHTTLSAHVAVCPACQAFRSRLADATTFLKTDAANVPVPDVNVEWRTLRTQLRNETARPSKKRPLAPVIWFGVSLAAVAALAFAFSVSRSAPQTDSTPADTITYVDQESGWLVVWASEAAAKDSG